MANVVLVYFPRDACYRHTGVQCPAAYDVTLEEDTGLPPGVSNLVPFSRFTRAKVAFVSFLSNHVCSVKNRIDHFSVNLFRYKISTTCVFPFHNKHYRDIHCKRSLTHN